MLALSKKVPRFRIELGIWGVVIVNNKLDQGLIAQGISIFKILPQDEHFIRGRSAWM